MLVHGLVHGLLVAGLGTVLGVLLLLLRVLLVLAIDRLSDGVALRLLLDDDHVVFVFREVVVPLSVQHGQSTSALGSSNHRDDAANEQGHGESPPEPGEVGGTVPFAGAVVGAAVVRLAVVVVLAVGAFAHISDAAIERNSTARERFDVF